MEHKREKVRLTSGNNSVELEATSISYGIRPIQVLERNINGDGIVIRLRNKKVISIEDWFSPDVYDALIRVISSPTISVAYYIMPEGETSFTVKDTFTAYVSSFDFSRLVLQYSIRLELEEP